MHHRAGWTMKSEAVAVGFKHPKSQCRALGTACASAGLDGYAAAVLLALWTHSNRCDTYTFVGQEKIAKHTLFSKRTIRRSITRLVKARLIESRVREHAGFKHANEYRIHWHRIAVLNGVVPLEEVPQASSVLSHRPLEEVPQASLKRPARPPKDLPKDRNEEPPYPPVAVRDRRRMVTHDHHGAGNDGDPRSHEPPAKTAPRTARAARESTEPGFGVLEACRAVSEASKGTFPKFETVHLSGAHDRALRRLVQDFPDRAEWLALGEHLATGAYARWGVLGLPWLIRYGRSAMAQAKDWKQRQQPPERSPGPVRTRATEPTFEERQASLGILRTAMQDLKQRAVRAKER
jgi:hypothetical protein